MEKYIAPDTEIILSQPQAMLAGSDPQTTDQPGSGEQLAKQTGFAVEDDYDETATYPSFNIWED